MQQLAYTLDQGGGNELRSIDLSWNCISAVGAAPLFRALGDGKCPRLRRFRVYWNYIGKSVQLLSTHTRWLNLVSIFYVCLPLSPRLGDGGASALAEALGRRHSHSLQFLDLEENGIGGEGATALAKVLAGMPQYTGLQSLNLSHNPLGREAGRQVIASFREGISCPASLNLAHTHISRSELRRLATTLRHKNCEVVIL